LSRYQNMKYQQIADHLQISVKTVETQMSKALQHMRLRPPNTCHSLLSLFYHFIILHFAFCHLHFAFCYFAFYILPFTNLLIGSSG